MTKVTVPGRSAVQLQKIMRRLGVIGVVLLGIGFLLMVLSGAPKAPWAFIGYGLLCLGAVTFCFALGVMVAAYYRELAEVRCSYTTLHYLHQDVEERDPKTGLTIRSAGEPFLSKEIRAARLAESYDAPPIPQGTPLPEKPKTGITLRPRLFVIVAIVVGVLVLAVRIIGFFPSNGWFPHWQP